MPKFSETLKKYRDMKGISLFELGNRVNPPIARSNLSNFETGERQPKLDTCMKLANALEMDPIELCGIELSEDDEIRFIMKYLEKNDISLKITEHGTVSVELPSKFLDYAIMQDEVERDLCYELDIEDEDDPRKSNPDYEKLQRRFAQEKMNYWINMYPEFDNSSFYHELSKRGYINFSDFSYCDFNIQEYLHEAKKAYNEAETGLDESIKDNRDNFEKKYSAYLDRNYKQIQYEVFSSIYGALLNNKNFKKNTHEEA